MRCTHGRNVRLLEEEETLMVDIDWINLQSCDEETLRIPQGTQFGGETVRLSCGHSLASNQVRLIIKCLAKVRQRKDLGGKRCGFVQLTQRSCDEEALRIPQGTQFGGETVRLSWGHSLASSKMQILLGVLKLEFECNYVLPVAKIFWVVCIRYDDAWSIFKTLEQCDVNTKIHSREREVLYARSDLHALGVYVTSSTLSGHGVCEGGIRDTVFAGILTLFFKQWGDVMLEPFVNKMDFDIVLHNPMCLLAEIFEHLLAEILRMEKEGAIQS
ncbi:hypothetical protein Tco_1329105 [Tanacetum coccineum]